MATGRVAVANPKSRDILEALDSAKKLGWIDPIIVNEKLPEESARECVRLINTGEADMLMKGDLDTSILLKAILDPDTGIRPGNRLSHVAVVESQNYDRLMLFTDGGVNMVLNETIAASIIENALFLALRLGNTRPNIAVMALVEKISPAIPETNIANLVASKYENDKRLTIEGPVPLDIALSSRAAKIKGVDSLIAGKTDIFIGPNITVTNFTVKGLLALGGARGGGIVLGANAPVILLSRSDVAETKLNSIALGMVARKGDL